MTVWSLYTSVMSWFESHRNLFSSIHRTGSTLCFWNIFDGVSTMSFHFSSIDEHCIIFFNVSSAFLQQGQLYLLWLWMVLQDMGVLHKLLLLWVCVDRTAIILSWTYELPNQLYWQCCLSNWTLSPCNFYVSYHECLNGFISYVLFNHLHFIVTVALFAR